jgi:hypothetical protein
MAGLFSDGATVNKFVLLPVYIALMDGWFRKVDSPILDYQFKKLNYKIIIINKIIILLCGYRNYLFVMFELI